MKTVLVVGAGRYQVAVIRRARELGLRVVAVDRNPEAVDGDDAQSELPGTEDRASLMAPRADEEDGFHSRAMLLAAEERASVPHD